MKEIITAIAASDTKTILHVVHYKPEHEVIGVIQVLHGMTEHIGRYKEFAKFFTDKGYAVIGHDMIGYGKTKSYGMKETYLEHWEDAVTDIESIRKFIQEKYPDIPIYQLGIGMGAYFGMAHQIQYPERYYKRIYIGAGRKNKFLLKLSSLYFDLKRLRKRQQIPVPSDQILNIFEKYYPENGDFSWRYRSNSCREKYMDDPLVNFQTTEGTIAEILIWTIMATLTSIIGKIISVKLVGNGISLILVSNILSSYPSDSANIYEVLMKGKKTYIAGLHLFFLLILITALFIFTVWLQDTEKKIPVTYSGKLQGKSTFKGVSTNTIPIKLCPGGVVPIIFASSLISFPILIAQIAGAKQNAVLKLLNSGYWFNTSKPWYTFGALIYLVLIFAFSYFYTEITMNPEEIANNIKKSGGNIAGIRAGSSTAEYLRKQMKYLIAIGSFCLCIIAIIPFIVSGLTGLSRLSFFGTSIIITVSVILETKKLILSKTQENYYMNRVKKGELFRG